MKAHALSTIGLYGDREMMLKAIEEGYTEFAFGSGPEINCVRIVGLFVLYHPLREKPVVAVYTWKDYNGAASVRGQKIEEFQNEREWEDFYRENHITLSQKMNLAKLMKDWTEPGLDYTL